MRRVVRELGLALLVLAASVGCSKEKCETCIGDSDCGSGMVCHPDLKICKPEGKAPACPVECENSKGCREEALCSLKGNKCVIGELDCAKSAQCSEEGKCTRQDLGEYGTCVTINPTDCQKSTQCVSLGHCSVDRKSRQCRALSDLDCKQSDLCTKAKLCKADVAKGECVLE